MTWQWQNGIPPYLTSLLTKISKRTLTICVWLQDRHITEALSYTSTIILCAWKCACVRAFESSCVRACSSKYLRFIRAQEVLFIYILLNFAKVTRAGFEIKKSLNVNIRSPTTIAMSIQNCVLLDSLENDDSTTASGVTFCLILRLYILVTWQCIKSLRSKVCTMFKRSKPTKVQ